MRMNSYPSNVRNQARPTTPHYPSVPGTQRCVCTGSAAKTLFEMGYAGKIRMKARGIRYRALSTNKIEAFSLLLPFSSPLQPLPLR
jgi:hypothetical protein